MEICNAIHAFLDKKNQEAHLSLIDEEREKLVKKFIKTNFHDVQGIESLGRKFRVIVFGIDSAGFGFKFLDMTDDPFDIPQNHVNVYFGVNWGKYKNENSLYLKSISHNFKLSGVGEKFYNLEDEIESISKQLLNFKYSIDELVRSVTKDLEF